MRESYKLQIEELKDRCQDRQEIVDDERRRFMDFKKQVALNAVNSRSGKAILPRVSMMATQATPYLHGLDK